MFRVPSQPTGQKLAIWQPPVRKKEKEKILSLKITTRLPNRAFLSCGYRKPNLNEGGASHEKQCTGYMSKINLFNSSGYPDPTAYEALTRVEHELHASRFRPIVYICSPFSGDTETNLKNARRYSRFALDQGYLPIAPHLLFPQFMDDSVQEDRDLALRMNIILLTKCAELWAFGDRISKGMSIEIARARRKGQTVRFFTDQCEEVS